MKTLKWIVIGVLVVGALIGLSFATGLLGAKYTEVVGGAQANAEHEVYKENKAHVEGYIADLANYKLELARTQDPAERQAIIQYINDKFANFDENEIENSSLRSFLIEVRSGVVR